jgi:uncharacterized delta-60 repeat protein
LTVIALPTALSRSQRFIMKKEISRTAVALCAIALFALCGTPIIAQTDVDPTYNGVPSLPLTAPVSQQLAVQADGKVLIWGASMAVQGIAKGRLVRLDQDGTLDAAFTYCNCGLDSLSNALPLPDGKILVAGSLSGASKVIRLNNDGSLDGTFNNANPPNGFGGSTARLVDVQSDGRFYTYRTQSFQGFGEGSLFRFNADGSLDTGFSSVAVGSGSPNFTILSAFLLAPDGKFYIASNTFAPFLTTATLRRRNADGTADGTWTTPSFLPQTSFLVNGLALQSDGGLLVSGDFSSVNGVAKADLVRILPAGNVDLNFTAPSFLSNGEIHLLSNGKILLSARTDANGATRIYRLDSDGGLDGSFTMDAQVTNQLNTLVLDASERIVFFGNLSTEIRLVRLMTDGSLDVSFNPDIALFGRIHAVVRQSDGKVIAAGEFTRFNGVSRLSIVRTNVDGSLDLLYDTGTGFDLPPKKMLLQSDGKLIAIGGFSSFNGTPVPGIVRLLTNGNIDPTFAVTPNFGGQILGFTLQSDGKVLVAGNFASINGVSRPGVARINDDGSVDAGFNALLGGTPTVNDVVVQTDGKIVIGGGFNGVQGFNRANFVRLDTSGTLDQGFNPSVGGVGGVWLTSDGKFLISGLGGDSITLQRRNADGSLDGTFAAQTFIGDNSQSWIDAVLIQSDGSLIVGGSYFTVGSVARRGIVRLTPTGSVDPLFLPHSADGRVRTVIDGGNGKVLVGGDFSRLESSTRAGLARLNVTVFRKVTPFDFDGDGRSDFTVFRPSTNEWYILFTSNWQYSVTNFGLAGDIVAPGDYDGDGKTDLGIYRPSTGAWWYAASSLGGAHRTVSFGSNGDIPRPADFDGDGRTDLVLFRPSNSTWYRLNSSGVQSSMTFGSPGDLPLVGDFDGDGKADPAVFRPSTGTWWYAASGSANAFRAVHWGQFGDVPVPGDYDGDGKTDYAVFRPSEGGWYILRTADISIVTMSYGLPTDRPIAADYDGDGKTDVAVFRPSTGIWYLLQSTAGQGGVQWGIATDVPAPAAFLP